MRAKKQTRETEETQAPPVSEGKQPADDQTAIDEVEKRKRKGKKEKLPKGYEERLPAGRIRIIKVNRDEVGKWDGLPIKIEEPDGTLVETDRVEIEGKSSLVHQQAVPSCGVKGSVSIETDGSVLIGKSRRSNPIEVSYAPNYR